MAILTQTLLTLVRGHLMALLVACDGLEQLESRLEGLEERVAALEDAAGTVNSNAMALYKLLDTNLFIVLEHRY